MKFSITGRKKKKEESFLAFFIERRGKTTQVSVQVQHNKFYHKISARQITLLPAEGAVELAKRLLI